MGKMGPSKPPAEAGEDPRVTVEIPATWERRWRAGGQLIERENEFLGMLDLVDDGRLLNEAVVELGALKEHLLDALRFGRKCKGKLTLEISFATNRKAIEIAGTVKMTPPAPLRGRTLFWLDDKQRLTTDDTRQANLDLPFGDAA